MVLVESRFDNGKTLKVTRSLIYVRDYAWRVGDGIRAVMVRDLAQVFKARWLRSSMLAHGIDDWQVACMFDCFEMAIEQRYSAGGCDR